MDLLEEHLTTGWEPDAPAGDTVVRQAVLSLAARIRHQGRIGGRALLDDGAAAAVDTGAPVPFANFAVLLRPDTDPEAVRRWFPAGRPFVVFSPFPMRGSSAWHLVGHPPLMTRPAGGAPPDDPAGATIDEVTTAAGLAEWATTLAEAYPMPGAAGGFHPDELGGPLRFWLARIGDRPVATAATTVAAGVNHVEYVSTAPEARGRGIGAAVTWRATTAAPDRPAVLLASDAGRPVYRAMGYLPVVRFTCWTSEGERAR